jgi:hypothetical protein
LGIIIDTDFNADDFATYGLVTPGFGVLCPENEPEETNYCSGLKLNEIGANLNEQFVEVYNSTNETLDLSGCGLKTNRSSAVYQFENLELAAGDFLAVEISDTKLTLTKTTTGTVYLLDSAGGTIDEHYYENLKAGTAYALVAGAWASTYRPTPNEPNLHEQYAACPVGQERNLATGRCRKIQIDEPLADCGEGKFRNPETNRCKSYNNLTTTLAPCKDGYYRNPDTNRCKKVDSNDGLTPCKEGYERNAETNRCRKIRQNNGADYGVKADETSDKSAFVGWAAVGAVALGGLSYVGFEFRHEIGKFIRKVRR